MSFFGDVFGFEKFHAGDLWDRIKDDPKRLVLGVDPWSTKIWNKALNRDDEPLVDQMGGPYGGHTISAFGNKDGGVYQRAQDAGINTGPGGGMHDAAHVISALYAGGYGAGKGGLFQSAPAESPFGFGESMQTPNFGGTPGFNPMAGGGQTAPGGMQQMQGMQGLFGSGGSTQQPEPTKKLVWHPMLKRYVWMTEDGQIYDAR